MLKETAKKEIRLIRYEWNHHKTILITIISILTLFSYLDGSLGMFFNSLGNYEYAGGFFAGFLYTFGATTPFAVVAFLILAENLNIWILTILGSLGGLISEYIIYDIAKIEAGKTIKIKKKKIRLQIKSKFLRKISPLIAGIIIATPIPDEFASILFGIEKYKLRDFLILTFVCKFVGILLIVGLGKII